MPRVSLLLGGRRERMLRLTDVRGLAPEHWRVEVPFGPPDPRSLEHDPDWDQILDTAEREKRRIRNPFLKE